ncbi:MAG: GxxExxY protein [Verrucomicrobia bacterium]|nr:GxxExxY protein [Verrucomicrobiota bacterium]
MGILIKHPISALSEKVFHRLDYQVMSVAFDLYNSIGNLWDEDDYKVKLLDCCLANGLNAKSEVQITVAHKEFSKLYFIDLLIEGSVYELKTMEAVASPHESQTLNYLFLTDTQHGKIINFRPDSLEWRFVSTSLTLDHRKSYNLETDHWISNNPITAQLPDLLSELLSDWGAYLDLHLYKEAVLFFIGQSSRDVNKRFCPLSPETLIHFTALSRKKSTYKKNLQKYLDASTHRHIDWINFNQNQIELHTLGKKSFCH